VAITLAPPGARCLAIQVAGASSFTRKINLSPEQSTVFTLAGLAPGTDTFSAKAFGVACAQSDGAPAGWESAELQAQIAAGASTLVTLSLVPVVPAGKATVTLRFPASLAGSSPALVPPGVLCVSIASTGANSVAFTAEVAPEASAAFAFGGLQPGDTTFSAQAFAVPCASIAGVPAWLASGGVPAHIEAGELSEVTLDLAEATWVISGKVTGPATGGVTIALTGAATGQTTTFRDGHYRFLALANGQYNLRPSKAGFSFTPALRSPTVSGQDVAGQDFTSVALPTYSISGSVAGDVKAGVTIAAAGPVNASAVTDDAGHYSISGLPGGTYTVTPSKPHYRFQDPSVGPFTLSFNITGLDFTAICLLPDLLAVWGANAGDAWAGGAGGVLLHWNGTAWMVASGLGANIRGIGGSGPGDVWAVGDYGTARYDGSTWTSQGGWGGDSYNAVWAYSPTEAWTVSSGYPLRWNGTQWHRELNGEDLAISSYGVWGTGPGDVWAVGNGHFVHWDGSSWAYATGDGNYLESVWGTSTTNAWAVGGTSSSTSKTVHWDGGAWSLVPNPGASYLFGVSGSGPDDVWAVGANGTAVHWDGGAWSSVPSGVSSAALPRALTAVWAAGANDAWAVGSRGLLLHWNGSAWAVAHSDLEN